MTAISIIIPVLNEAGTISSLLHQLKDYCCQDEIEIIVVDGGSEDATAKLATPLCHQLIVTEQAGRALQMNAGAAVASGDSFLFLHADTQLNQNSLSLIQLNSNQSWGFFCLRLSGKSILFRVIERMINWRSRLTSVATGDQCLFVKRELFNHLKGYANIPLMEDVELSKRLRKVCAPYVVTEPVITSSRRWEQRGIIRTVLLMWQLRFLYFMGVSPQKLAGFYR